MLPPLLSCLLAWRAAMPDARGYRPPSRSTSCCLLPYALKKFACRPVQVSSLCQVLPPCQPATEREERR